MKTPHKLILGASTVIALAAPIVPKTVNITINEPVAVVAEVESCKIISTLVDDKGTRTCEYRCQHKTVAVKSLDSTCDQTMSSLKNNR
jgi:membrane-bound inhibitor of C-type lysozyme